MEYPESERNVTGTHEKRRRWRRAVFVLACAVVFCTTYALILPAITLSAEPKCGLEEHTHTEDCYETRLVCGQAEDPETDPAPAEAPETDPTGSQEAAGPAHVHTDACYEQVLTCEKPEHTHTDACWSDPDAAEDPRDWEPQDLTGDWNRDTLAIALAQEGYRPSEDYFTVDDAGEHIGYTRYGDWSGDPFGEWNLSFAAFCLHFAGAAEEAFPAETSAEAWRTALDALDLYQPLEDAVPGDLIFLDSDGDGEADRVGIFTGWQDAEPETAETAGAEASSEPETSAGPEQRFAVMEGDLDGEAAQAHYDPEDAALLGRASPDEAADAWYLCGEKVHIHGEDCYDETGALTCGKTVHIHSEGCQLPESRSFTYEDNDLLLTVTVLTPDPLPEDTELTVTEEDASALAMEDADTEEGGQWLLRGLALTQNGQALEIADCRMTAEVALTERVFAPLAAEAAVLAEDAAPEAEVGVVLSAWQADEDAGLQEVESVLLEEETATLTVPVENGMLALYASSTTNPQYKVQYYAYIPRFATSGSNPLTVIDTSSGANAGKATLPQNGVTPTTKNIYLRDTGKTTGSVNNQQKNNGTASKLYAVQTTNELTKMYTENTFEYIKAPNPAYINKLEENGNYQLSQVWILKDSKTADDNTNNWNVYDAGNVHFTNRKDAANASQNIVCITDTTVIRLIYNTSDASFSTGTTFYDYDITNGTKDKPSGLLEVGASGINSKSNYRDSARKKSNGSSERSWKNTDVGNDVLAFGNQNCGTGMGNFEFAGGYLNAFNSTNPGVANGCTFGLVSGLSNGEIQYNEWLSTPRLFNETGEANGKTTYEGSSLTFSRVGDTYTLTSAALNGGSTITGLDNFFNPSPESGTIYDGTVNGKNESAKFIATNNFWPLDSVTNTDPHFGQNGNDYPIWGRNNNGNALGSYASKTFPESDDGRAHNCFFGMHFSLTFTLTADYVGPLDYLFYGDDDMWVFLDGKLVCDIGGVHSSVGEYVNLWDYVSRPAAGEEKTYTLTFFYTERGASGSTCYMNFTLPSVSGATPQQKSGDLRVEKEVVGLDNNNQDFTFTIDLKNRDGSALVDDFIYDKYITVDGKKQVVSDLIVHGGGSFTLKSGEYAIIKYLPFGTYYTITETNSDGYSTAWRGNDGITHSGIAATGYILEEDVNRTSVLHFTNTATPNTNLNVKKVGPDGNALSGATFTLTDSTSKPVEFIQSIDGTYTVYHEELYPEIKEGTEYYIALASNENGKNWVIGQDTSAKKLDAKLQEKTGAAAQRVRIYHQTDGSYSFQSVANGKWLDLDECKTKNGTLVRFWANDNVLTTETAQKWYLLSNGDGTYRIKPKAAVENGSSAVLDMNTGIPSEGQKIQAWTSNNSNAQKWKLVPVNPAEKPETTTTITVSSQGQLFLKDLIPGTYTLTESTAPGGYQKLTAPITFTVDRTGKITLAAGTSSSVAEVSEDNLLLKVINQPQSRSLTLKKIVSGSDTKEMFEFEVEYTNVRGESCTKTVFLQNKGSETISNIAYGTTVKITEKDHAGFSVSYKNGKVPLEKSDSDSCSFTITDDVTITAVNSTGYELPSTGGLGTVWFTLAGILLMTGAAALTILRRRAKEGGPE